MPTQRGFVRKIEVGRAGLVRIFLIHADGSNGVYEIQDLDADPERFNERLSALNILRDAMNRAEPVEIEFIEGNRETGLEIQVAARISRDALTPLRKIEQVVGLVLDLQLYSENGIVATGERHDLALVVLLSSELTSIQLLLDLQAPERLVVSEQFELLRDAQLTGYPVRLLVDNFSQGNAAANTDPITETLESRLETSDRAQTNPRRQIIAVAVDANFSAFAGNQTVAFSGFVESLSLIRPLSLPSLPSSSNFAHVRFTTAPEFSGSGNVVGLEPFKPTTVDLLVPRNSLTYELFKSGLCNNLRMRVNAAMASSSQEPTPAPGTRLTESEGLVGTPVLARGAEGIRPATLGSNPSATAAITTPSPAPATSLESPKFGIALFAELVAPLASASRPVWLTIARESLDLGPDGFKCTTGLPSSDLTPLSLRDLRIPYPAVWRGLGCFNPGVYRFQLKLPSSFSIQVDGEALCLHDASESGIKLAHACLDGDHEITVEIDHWICDYEFGMDVYRLR